MKNFEEIEKRCIEDLSLDYVPLNDVVREFSGYEKLFPTEDEFLKSLDFLRYLIDKYNLKCYEGLGGAIITKSTDELMNWLKEKWHTNQYDQINYGIWFEK